MRAVSSLVLGGVRIVKGVVSDSRIIIAIWLVVGVVIPYGGFFSDNYSNYTIVRNSFGHLGNEQNLYAAYPEEYGDRFVYGPTFSVLMGPFASLPDVVGIGLYLLVSAGVLFAAIQSLPIEKLWRNVFCLICLVEFGNNQQHFQSNAFMAGLIILAFTCVMRDKNILAGVCVALGLFLKLYGVVGIVFLLFSRRKGRFLVSFLCCSVACYFLPVVFSSLRFVNQSYGDWLAIILEKNEIFAGLWRFQDQSIYGLVRRLTGTSEIPQLFILMGGLALLGLPYLRFWAYSNPRFRFLSLACVLMFVVLFSSGSENPTYVILQCGVAVWFCAGSSLPMRFRVGLLVGVLVFSSLVPTDLFPRVLGDFFNRYSLRVLPCVVVWLVGLYEMFKCGKLSVGVLQGELQDKPGG